MLFWGAGQLKRLPFLMFVVSKPERAGEGSLKVEGYAVAELAARAGVEAARRGIAVTIVIDFIHVIEYPRKAAWCFHQARDPAAGDWVTAQGLAILHGRVTEVTATLTGLAAAGPPRPGSEHDKIIRTTLAYLDATQPWMDYPRALAAGWPISTGVIEGACRHLVQDRMGITGARRGLEGAQAILWLRAITANDDMTAYRDWRISQEHQRNHQSRYQDSLRLAA